MYSEYTGMLLHVASVSEMDDTNNNEKERTEAKLLEGIHYV